MPGGAVATASAPTAPTPRPSPEHPATAERGAQSEGRWTGKKERSSFAFFHFFSGSLLLSL